MGGAWPAEEVSFNFSDSKLEAFRPSDAWFVNYKRFKFLRQNLAVKFEGGRGLQISANLPSNLKTLFLHIKAVWLSTKFYVVAYVYVLGFWLGPFVYTYTTCIFQAKKLSFYTKREFRLTNYYCAIVYVYVRGFWLSPGIYTSTTCVLTLCEYTVYVLGFSENLVYTTYVYVSLRAVLGLSLGLKRAVSFVSYY